MWPSESAQPQNARDLSRLFNELGYKHKLHRPLLLLMQRQCFRDTRTFGDVRRKCDAHCQCCATFSPASSTPTSPSPLLLHFIRMNVTGGMRHTIGQRVRPPPNTTAARAQGRGDEGVLERRQRRVLHRHRRHRLVDRGFIRPLRSDFQSHLPADRLHAYLQRHRRLFPPRDPRPPAARRCLRRYRCSLWMERTRELLALPCRPTLPNPPPPPDSPQPPIGLPRCR